MTLEQNVFSKQFAKPKNIATKKISSNFDHWFKSYGHQFVC